MRCIFFNLPLDQKKCEELFKRQIGTVSVEYSSEDLFKPDKKGILVDIVAGAHYFLVEKCENQLLKYFHSTPGTGTLVASIDLNEVPICDIVRVCFNWSPTEINLYIEPVIKGHRTYAAKGIDSARCYRVGKDRSVYRIGDEGVEVIEVTVYEKGRKQLGPTAIQSWNIVLKALAAVVTSCVDSLPSCQMDVVYYATSSSATIS
ncbi:MAG: hypothetical protein JW765_05755, partial [Deltaproteobacteria bacterium]|nr:hypothetical protein [Candidatus Zymogenaceae bacterium]